MPWRLGGFLHHLGKGKKLLETCLDQEAKKCASFLMHDISTVEHQKDLDMTGIFW